MAINIGLDIGGTKIEIIALDSKSGKELYRQRVNTPDNYPDFLSAVTRLVTEAETALQSTGSVGISIPGIVNFDKTFSKAPANLPFLRLDFAQEVEKILNREIRMENDARCFALSEAIDGAAKGYETAYCIIIGTGVGGSLVVNRKIIRGANNIAGEWGHLPLPFATESELSVQCGCGRMGCIETQVSGKYLLKQYNDCTDKPAPSVGAINQLADKGDRLAQSVMNNFYQHLAAALLNIVVIVDPDVIVVGGGCSRVEGIYTKVPALIENLWKRGKMNLNIKKAMHGDSSGVRGADWLWKEKL